MTDYWKELPAKVPIETGYAIWADSDMWYPCTTVACGKRTSLMVHIDSIPPSHFCSLECMGEDIRADVLASAVQRTEATSAKEEQCIPQNTSSE